MFHSHSRSRSFLLAGALIALSVPCAATEVPPGDDGEILETVKPGKVAADTDAFSPAHPRGRVSTNLLATAVILASDGWLPVSIDGELFLEPKNSWVAGAAYAFGAGKDDLRCTFQIGPRWYFDRAYQGLFLDFRPFFSAGKSASPLLFGFPVAAGYLVQGAPWFASFSAGFGPGVYFPAHPVGTRTHENALVTTLAGGFGLRF